MKKLTFIFFVAIIFFQQNSIKAQDSVEVVILSDRIGPFIEPEENDYFNLFPGQNNFVLCYFTRDSIEVYSGRIYYQNNKKLQEKKFEVKKERLISLSTKINNFEKIKSDNYKSGQNPAELSYTWIKKSDVINIIQTSLKKNSDYPLFAQSILDYSDFFKHYPQFGISAGVTYTNFNFDDLNILTNVVDKFFKDEGYFVHPIDPNYKLGPVFRFKGIIEFTTSLSAALSLDYNLSPEQIKYKAMSIMGFYSFNNLLENFAPFAGVGYTRNNFNVTIDYGNAVVDTNGRQLESVILDGGTEGLIFEAGIKVLLGNSFSIGIAGDYYFLTIYKYKEEHTGFKSEVKPGNFSAGIFFNISF